MLNSVKMQLHTVLLMLYKNDVTEFKLIILIR